MRYLIIGDLHGQVPKFHVKDFDAIIAPGDFCSDAPRKYMFESMRRAMADPTDDVKWYDIVGKRKARAMVKKSVSDGRRILEILNDAGVPVYVVPGNWDWTGKDYGWTVTDKDYWSTMRQGLDNIVDCHHKLVQGREAQFIGHGIISGPEFPPTKKAQAKYSASELKSRRKKYESQKGKVETLFRRAAKRDKPIVFIPHNVPYNTPLDMIDNPQSPRNGQHFGSLIAKELCVQYQPKICVGGHMHEWHKDCRIGRTRAINAGFGGKVNTLLELKNNRITKLEYYDA